MNIAKLIGFGKVASQSDIQKKRSAIYRNLMRREAQVGGTVFGPVKNNGTREFFCLDESTWVWHEEWTDENGQHRVLNTRYDVRPNGILKAQNGQGYQMVSADEAKNLQQAAHTYLAKVKKEIYQTA